MPIFIDSNFFLALANQDDQHHEAANGLSWKVRGPFLTTEAVLIEVANSFSKRRHRHQAVNLIQNVGDSHEVEVLPISHELFRRGFTLYTNRQDKDWSLTDCISFVVMEDRELKEALTADRHFVEAGYRALMLEG